ncbi:phosphate/phosphite/phosphonate ABC transporter substrate-binding protein [Thiohalorhabdus sp. Cl-TMA]|uniref:Phosphate/phosphite/phosphonate ABC transporter substrate-binding protein n=1 Tax=Thiohalorhabdus methylotrophus TaxID=3242694 RepID=A0ABV4TS77_9GAMM
MQAPLRLAKRLFFRGLPLLAGLFLLAGAPTASAEPPERLRLLLPPLSSADQVYARFQPLAQHLEKALDIPVEARVAGDLESLLRLARQDRPQIAYLCPLIYTRLADEGALTALARLERHGQSTFRTVVVVRDGSPYARLEELEGARFAYGNPVCAASRLVPEAMFAEAGLNPGRDFFEKRTLGSNENALYSVAADLFDATAVDESSARPFLEKGVLRALRYSRPIPQYLLAANRGIDAAFRRRLTGILTSLQAESVLRAIGSDVNGFVATTDADYDVIRAMERRHGTPSTPLNLLDPADRTTSTEGRRE